jgi:hypothetical protein
MALEENDALSRRPHASREGNGARHCIGTSVLLVFATALYRETRINWLSKDYYVIEEAEKRYQQYKSQGSSNH